MLNSCHSAWLTHSIPPAHAEPSGVQRTNLQFVLPFDMTLDTAPQPLDERVHLRCAASPSCLRPSLSASKRVAIDLSPHGPVPPGKQRLALWLSQHSTALEIARRRQRRYAEKVTAPRSSSGLRARLTAVADLVSFRCHLCPGGKAD